MELLRDLWHYVKTRKRYWLVPTIVILLVLGLLIFLTNGSAITPFLYPFF